MTFLNLSKMSSRVINDNNAPFPDSSSLIDEPLQFPFYHVHRDSFFPRIPDGIASLLVNVLAYWVVSLSYHYLDVSGWQWVERYRIQESDEVKKRNLVTRGQVVRLVSIQQCMQTAFGIAWIIYFPVPPPSRNYGEELRVLSLKIARSLFIILGEQHGREFVEKYGSGLTYSMYWWIIPMSQFFFALCARFPLLSPCYISSMSIFHSFFLDTYQYFLHRTFHEVKFLYKHFHSMHHRLYVPFAFGALYGHPFEGAILDGLGAGLAHTIAGMTERQAIILFGFATYKTVDDHCGYAFPFDPFQIMSGNNADYHDIHHQVRVGGVYPYLRHAH